MIPTATLASVTATGDVVVGPGAPNVLKDFLPCSCIGDAVAGAVCVGAITIVESIVLSDFRPHSTMGAEVVGVNPETGIPVTTAIAIADAMNVLS